jgi:NAD(P)-dependent dehydrogenase (short-subunit alcohol dehydrogenase family)/rhamnose utilization protein RhaD (predicted bifunctional aldolase and dehydrogenase)
LNRALSDLIHISRRLGSDRSLIWGGGGNTSVKTDDGKHMYVKASGAAVADIGPQKGWRRLDLRRLRELLDDGRLAGLPESEREAAVAVQLQLCCADAGGDGGRPSVESHMHAMLGRCVAHLHPLSVLAYVCARNGRAELESIFADDDLPPLWIPYATPGYMLARRIGKLAAGYARRRGHGPTVLFLDRHGLLVSADDADELVRKIDRVVRRVRRHLPPPARAKARRLSPQAVTEAKLAIRRASFESTGRRVAVKHVSASEVWDFLARADARNLAATPAVMPDEIVYASGSPLWVENAEAAALHRVFRRGAGRGSGPSCGLLARDLGLFAVGSAVTLDVVADTVSTSLAVRRFAGALGGPRPLSRAQRQFIETWEAESYRQKLAAGPGDGELGGHIAVVTGAGSGLGRSIALGLARAGAAVALVDIDGAAAEKTARSAPQETGRPALAVTCDVTDEAAVESAYGRILAEWGGLDILVNAAGIAPSHELVDFPVDEWRRALEVNLTGYFLMARVAARIMVAQGMGGNIINLSSKSGLEASRSNTPYNATKAGEIHMARGWALELGEHGIRVNSVAPGNVFEDSNIWSPKYTRECARKQGIRPAEVIPHYVSKTALRLNITGQDVADAVVYLCSDKARTVTGQTLVPDSGQVMVR